MQESEQFHHPTSGPRKIKLFLLGAISLFLVGSLAFAFSQRDQPGIQAIEKIDFQPEFLTSSQRTQTITNFEIVKTYTRPGRTQYYTQGLRFKNSTTLLESTGLYGESALQFVDLATMKVIKRTKLSSKYFGEGADYFTGSNGVEIIQLTWRERKMHIYNKTTLKFKRSVALPQPIKEGWGLATRKYTSNGKKIQRIYVTDGTKNIYLLNPTTFAVTKTIKAVTSSGTKITKLNELEFVNGKLWANVYLTNNIVIINPDTGFVEKIIKLDSLRDKARAKAASMGLSFKSDYVLNGIAYHSPTKRLIVTGKKWPLMWQIRIPDVTN